MDSIVSWIGEIPRSQAYTFAGFTAAYMYLALQYVDVHAANGGEVAAAPAPAPARLHAYIDAEMLCRLQIRES